MTKKLVLYVGPFGFPNGGAAARRILGNCNSLRDAGFSVAVVSGQSEGQGSVTRFEGIDVFSVGERNAEHLPRWLKRLAYFQMGKRTIDWLDSLKQKPHAIILYSGYTPYLARLIPWAERNSVRLVFDAVEWYSPDSAVGYISPYQLNIEYAMRFLVGKTLNIVSISKFLSRYYEDVGCNVIKVPPSLDVKNTPWKRPSVKSSPKIQLAYTGSPGKKDMLNDMLLAVLQAKKEGANIYFKIAGVTREESRVYPALQQFSSELVDGTIEFLGRLTHEESMTLVSDSDYSLLLRRIARYSQAGFPTKFVESFTVGTPVISNITSDLGEYLHDGITGYVSAGCSPESLKIAIIKASKMESEKYAEMREACRAVALESFDYRKYSDAFANLLNTPKF